jgi:DNA-binding NarL/FixJ family response regulator
VAKSGLYRELPLRHTAHVPLTLVIVDDHADFRVVARTLLTAHGSNVVGEAIDARDAVEMCASLRPDVVLVDVHLRTPTDSSWPVCSQISIRHLT